METAKKSPCTRDDNNQPKPYFHIDPNEPVTYEHVQEIIGKSGLWQNKIILLASFAGFCRVIFYLIYGFIGVVPDYWCKQPDLLANYSKQELRKELKARFKDEQLRCVQQDVGNITQSLFDETKYASCGEFEFDDSEFESTVVTEWQLVCDSADWVPFVQVLFTIGIMVGSPIFGVISDRLGRKFAMLTATCIAAIVGPLTAFAPNFPILLVLRFVLGFIMPGLYDCSYVLTIEIISKEGRAKAGNYINLPYALGYTVLPVIAYFIRSWRPLQLVCSIPAILLIFSCRMLPESPLWLIRKGRLEDAEKILRQAAKVNKSEDKIPINFSKLLNRIHDQEWQSESASTLTKGIFQVLTEYLSIFTSPQLRPFILILSFSWGTIGMVYLGLGLNSSNLPTDRYTYFFINGLLEFPAYLLTPYFISRFGRKRLFIGLMWICGVALVTCLLLPENSAIIVLLSFLGKLVVCANYSLAYLYSSELFPIGVRNCALGICCMMGQLGSAIAPFIVDILARGHEMLPSLVFGSFAILAGFLSLILPETGNQGILDAVLDEDEIESMKM